MSRVRIVGGTIAKHTVGKHNMYAEENIVFHSDKIVSEKGEEKGVTYGEPKISHPEFKIEKSTYELESKFALEQLFAFAKKDSKAMFCFWASEIFGADIPLEAYEKLYEDASDKKESINPKIVVALDVPGYGATYNFDKSSKYANHIVISQGFIDNALISNEYQKALLLSLVEEFGHHLDYLLRNEYSSVNGDASGDEGAAYSSTINKRYKKYIIDPFKEKNQHYATAVINGEEKKLIWDFSDLHEKLAVFVENRIEKDDNYFAGFEFFGAGLGDSMHGLGHQSIENRGLGEIDRYRDRSKDNPNKERLQIYFGNWLRDFSQFVDPMVVRPMANALEMLSEEYKTKNNNPKEFNSVIDDLGKLMEENKVTHLDRRTFKLPVNIDIQRPDISLNYQKVGGFSVPTGFSLKGFEAQIKWEPTTISPVKLSREAITTLVELLGIKEFGKLKTEADNKEGKPQNFMKYLSDFRVSYAKITPELLGVYKPQEHIDNPLALHPKFICEANKAKGMKCPPPDLNHKLDPDFVKDPIDSQWNNNKDFGTKNYIRGNGPEPFESAFDCFINFINKSDPNTVQGRINFGAALHILEDYFAHSNFCELAIMKVYDPEVFPWDNIPATAPKDQLKRHKADISSNSFIKNGLLDRSKIKFNTVSNPDLHSSAVANYLKTNPNKNASDYYASLGANSTTNRGLYYSMGEAAIVQTGSFGLLDTIASIAPKINNKIFSIHVEEQEKMKEGERTFNDALIYELLKDVSNAQADDTKETNSNYKGTNDGVYADVFLKYLQFRDFMVKERVLGYSFKDVTNVFGIFEFVTQYIKVIQNIRNHFLSLTAINLIDDYQTYLENELTLLENGTWKVNSYGPSHTQLAKDNGIQPLHHLAVELVANAIHQVGELFKNRDLEGIKNLARRTLFVHPMYTDWMDELVINWCKKNSIQVKFAHQASIVLYGIRHAYQEIAELSHEIQIIRDFGLNDEQKKEYDSAIAGMSNRWHKGKERLDVLWKKQGLPAVTVKDAEETHQEHLEQSGYGK
ncbi:MULTISPECIES: Het-C domain-containing protein [Flavobacterium]|uniref:Heterokaryon incompatibility protein Het-C n=1 Tax=Flavobacterium hankyongi TaxID=1176532 RepID=A0ABP9A4W6_9FLAO|nr:Het-C domain-containing protein [Flavobacterium sp. N1846]